MLEDPGDRREQIIQALMKANDQRQRFLMELSFALIAAGVIVLLRLPRLPVVGLRRGGGGALLGFGGWLDFAAHREWKDCSAALEHGLARGPRRWPRGLRSGLGIAFLLATALLVFVHRR